jgi:putative addiction module component (TIGR02574 family)
MRWSGMSPPRGARLDALERYPKSVGGARCSHTLARSPPEPELNPSPACPAVSVAVELLGRYPERMSQTGQLGPYEELSVAERIELLQQLWDEIAESPDEIELTAAQRAELDRRLEDYHRDPEAGISWEALRASLRQSR